MRNRMKKRMEPQMNADERRLNWILYPRASAFIGGSTNQFSRGFWRVH